MPQEFSLEQGVSEAFNRIKEIKEKPKIIAIYGFSNDDKTFFTRNLMDSLIKKKMSISLKVPGSSSDSDKDVVLFHFSWDGGLKLYLNKEIKAHLNIGIYNPEHKYCLKGDYDLIIQNQMATLKTT